jgi:type I restriction enzyme S subunit
MKSTAFHFQPGDVLYGRLRPYLNKVLQADFEGLCSSEFIVMPARDSFDPKYLAFYLSNHEFVAFANQLNQGDRPRVSFDQIGEHEVPLAPVAEQRRIVVRLESLLERVDACQERLAKIPSLLKRFRQSVLAAACSGRLTADWREENPKVESAAEFVHRSQQQRKARYDALCIEASRNGQRKPKRPKNEFEEFIDEGAVELPDYWCVTRIGDISDCLDHLRVPVNKDERLARQGSIPYYGANGQVGTIDDYLFDEELVLVVEDETFIGREKPFSYVVRGKSWVNNHAHVLRALGGMPVAFLNICLSYYDFTPLTSGTTGRRKLTQEAMLDARLAIPPVSEQQEIVGRVEKLFALADQIEARYAEGKKRVDGITQSILAKAFRGELVPTEYELAKSEGRTFESAEELLERIKANGKPATGGKRRDKKRVAVS